MTVNEAYYIRAMEECNPGAPLPPFPPFKEWGVDMMKICLRYTSNGRKMFLSVLSSCIAHMSALGSCFKAVCETYDGAMNQLRDEVDSDQQRMIAEQKQMDGEKELQRVRKQRADTD